MGLQYNRRTNGEVNAFKRLLVRTVPGYENTEAGVDLIIQAVDRADPRPVWFSFGAEDAMEIGADIRHGAHSQAKYCYRSTCSVSDRYVTLTGVLSERDG